MDTGKKSPESNSPKFSPRSRHHDRSEKNVSNLWAWGQRSFGRLGTSLLVTDSLDILTFLRAYDLGLGLEIEQEKESVMQAVLSSVNSMTTAGKDVNPEGQIWKAKWQVTRVPVHEEFVRFISVASGSSHSLVRIDWN